MDKRRLKKFAMEARSNLMEGVKARLLRLGITEEGVNELSIIDTQVIDKSNRILTSNEARQYYKLVADFKSKARKTDATQVYQSLQEEIAYTWFNRITAIRYMEIHHYLPAKKRMLSSIHPNRKEPDAVSEIRELVGILKLEHAEIQSIESNEKLVSNALFKYVLLKQCHQLGDILPSVFQAVEEIQELLMPDNIYRAFIEKMVHDIPETEWQSPEIIGWLFQYYNAEKKDQIGGLKYKAISKNNLPVITQLFTPKWIVEYMLQNSLGKLYNSLFPENKLSQQWEFFLTNDTVIFPTPEHITTIEDIKIIDPACGSGHILIHTFDMLYTMYEERGYSINEIPKLIIEKNIFGLDIDKRSLQVTHVVLLLKVLEKIPNFLKKRFNYEFQVMEWRDTTAIISNEALEFLSLDDEVEQGIRELEESLINAKQFGSLQKFLAHNYQEWLDSIANKVAKLELEDIYISALQLEIQEKLIPLLKIASIATQKYDVVVTNPPYLNKYNPELKRFINKNYPDAKADLYAAFIQKCFLMLQPNGYEAILTPYTWMFIISYEKLRIFIQKNGRISSLVQLEYAAFEDATVPICTFVLQNQLEMSPGEYVNLGEFLDARTQQLKLVEAANNSNVSYRFRRNFESFNAIDSSPIAYWVSPAIVEAFKSELRIRDWGEAREGMTTADNKRFLRFWYEVSYKDIALSNASSHSCRWFPYNKGGKYRKWYGNNEYVVNWENNGFEIMNNMTSTGKIRSHNYNLDYIGREGITWSSVTSGQFSARSFEAGFLFDGTGSSLFLHDKTHQNYILALLCSKVVQEIFGIINPTVRFQPGNIASVPILGSTNKTIDELVEENICLAKLDWDSVETSWDFVQHPFLAYQAGVRTIEEAFSNWEVETQKRLKKMKQNEELLNQIFIDNYRLSGELTPEMTEKDLTIRKANKEKDTKSFLSYLLGVILGRYSLDTTGLAYAGGEMHIEDYIKFKPDLDNIIPITPEAYFEDDIIHKIDELLIVIFGNQSLDLNWNTLADNLGRRPGEEAKARIRRYFSKEFYKDHIKVYQKRPIYWMFTSGKLGAFKGLIYAHRYNRDLLARIRMDYVLELTKVLENYVQLEQFKLQDTSYRGRAQKNIEVYQRQLEELKKYAILINHLASQRITLDLNDGIENNYQVFQNVIVQDEKSRTMRINLLEKI
ncbi:BREX-1 system adenine-specific DNA-methyltransferase PglX [Listeria booriae]|uniref:BREX-1 system adenine-specific DNA-methyltransferase PglX n=1 Tax=Listeria booriae TaxID=1552123 RepID=UPI0016298C84|nr:BREX-1 system adenine-specific DNA-methyltransferase PglX [Listeria booriae]MBC2189685.1 BREX-1 system adenine-specific DNA-methyltransferase PglX [Listeria booriae]